MHEILKFQGSLLVPHWLPTWALAYVGDFTRVPSRLRFTCQVWLRWKPHKNIWWLSKKTQEKKPKTDEKTRRWTKKHMQVLKHLPHQCNSTTSKLLQQYYISFFSAFFNGISHGILQGWSGRLKSISSLALFKSSTTSTSAAKLGLGEFSGPG